MRTSIKPFFIILSFAIFFAMPFQAVSSSSGGATNSQGFLGNASNMDDLVQSIGNGSFDINTVTNGAPVYSTVLPGSAGALSCDFLRQLKCGGVPFIIMTVSIFTVGMLTLMKKIKPYYAILIVACIFIMINADQVTKIVLGTLLGWTAEFCVCTNFHL